MAVAAGADNLAGRFGIQTHRIRWSADLTHPFTRCLQIRDDLILPRHDNYALRTKNHCGNPIAIPIHIVKLALFGHSIGSGQIGIAEKCFPEYLIQVRVRGIPVEVVVPPGFQMLNHCLL